MQIFNSLDNWKGIQKSHWMKWNSKSKDVPMCKYLKLHGQVQLGEVAAGVEKGETKNNEGVEEKQYGFYTQGTELLRGRK